MKSLEKPLEKETRLSIRVDPEEYELLKAFASSKKMSLAEWVRETLLFQAGQKDDRLSQVETRLAALEFRMNQNHNQAA